MELTNLINLILIWLNRIAALAGVVVLLVPLLSFRRLDQRARQSSSGLLAGVLHWPYMIVMTILFVLAGVLLWKPVPVALTPPWQAVALICGSWLYYPAIAIYLWGYKALGEHFGLSAGFGATLYLNHQLIQTGPYQYVRHPMYLGVMLAAAGALLIFRTWAMLFFTPLSLGIILRARREETLLAQAFGVGWQAYKKRVPAWIPNPGKINKEHIPN